MQNQSDEIQTKRKRAKGKLTLRILVALYLLYLTKDIVAAAVQGTSSLPLWVTGLISAVFLLASVAFGIYAWREYKQSLAVAASDCKTGYPEKEDEDCTGNRGLK